MAFIAIKINGGLAVLAPSLNDKRTLTPTPKIHTSILPSGSCVYYVLTTAILGL